MNFYKKLAKVLIENSYMNDKTCGIPSSKNKNKVSHILEAAPTHVTEYQKNCTKIYKYQQYICNWPNYKKRI